MAEAQIGVGGVRSALRDKCLEGLVARICDGDNEALTALYALTVAIVRSIATHIVRNAADADEIVGDVYQAAWQKAPSFDPEKGPVVGWLCVMARRRAFDFRRFETRACRDVGRQCQLARRDVEMAVAGERAYDDILCDHQAISGALDELSVDRRDAIRLAFYEGYSHEQIAAHKKLPVGTVKSHIRRGLKVLRTQLSLYEVKVPIGRAAEMTR